ncbi:hypothetical protein EYB25_007629 [Talaromyces marneffei]|nr:hypothetical protein EYB25_007629 [Talaromyces marneffei]
MLQPILTPEKLWPGGIPASVRPHPTDDLTNGPEKWDFKDWKEECKGWCQFVEEEWVSKTDLNEEMQQRRTLIERWASADQAFRDSYQERAPAPKSAVDYPPHLLSKVYLGQDFFFCLAGVDKRHHPDNYIRLVKNLILLYLHDNKSGNHPLSHSSGREYDQIPELLADSSTIPDFTKLFSHHDLLINLYLHSADFRVVSMTRFGTVVFPYEFSNKIYTVIDQDNLNQGRVAVMTFKPNGETGEYANVLPWNLADMINFYYGLGRPCHRLFDTNDIPFTARYLNKP